ncbi:threonine dehydratase [Pseudoxanthomonas suwonensis]|uniref:Threonine dehydratase n=1 Tax=Pseudoxanthomonas suwonensis TaxID=314722 RepID=A0A0E3UMQ1_9GAMM|nr:threonine dehydratase [Pseudoxanthomonas suwonensis]AKC86250.1 threonine dehydratase [Pseudoxanthomonas suwonensis]
MPDTGRASASSGEPDVGDVAAGGVVGGNARRGDAGMGEVDVADVLAAQSRLRRYLPVTPMHHAERFGVMLKLENLQRTGSYKVRGALNALLAARERGDRRPVICASAGNHAQGLAWAAYRLGVQAITVMPHGAPENKIAGVAHWGATVRQHGDSYDEAYAFACELAEQNGYRFLSAFDDPDVIAGQGTVGIEIAAHAPDVVIVPIGGGGLASGVALALKAQGVRVVGAQVEGVDSMARAIRGDTTPRDPARSLADGVRVRVPGFLTRRLCARLLDDVVIVREAELRETLVRLALEENLIAEGAGALALAAGRRVAGRRKCAVVSGGNIDAATLATLLSEVRPRPPRKPRRRVGELPPEQADPALARKVAVAKSRPAATLSPSPTISVPTAPSAPQPVSEEEFTW